MCENILLFYRVSTSVCHSGTTFFATTVLLYLRLGPSIGRLKTVCHPTPERLPFLFGSRSPKFAWYPCLDPCAEFGAWLGLDSYNDRFTSASPTPPNQTKKVPRLPRSKLKSRTRLVSSAYDSLGEDAGQSDINVNKDVRTRTVT